MQNQAAVIPQTQMQVSSSVTLPAILRVRVHLLLPLHQSPQQSFFTELCYETWKTSVMKFIPIPDNNVRTG